MEKCSYCKQVIGENKDKINRLFETVKVHATWIHEDYSITHGWIYYHQDCYKKLLEKQKGEYQLEFEF